MRQIITDSAKQAIISRSCWQALWLNLLLILVFPEALANTLWLGQTWLWLTATPVCMLLVIHRHRFAMAWGNALVSTPPRRRGPSAPRQARHRGVANKRLRQAPMRAA